MGVNSLTMGRCVSAAGGMEWREVKNLDPMISGEITFILQRVFNARRKEWSVERERDEEN